MDRWFILELGSNIELDPITIMVGAIRGIHILLEIIYQ